MIIFGFKINGYPIKNKFLAIILITYFAFFPNMLLAQNLSAADQELVRKITSYLKMEIENSELPGASVSIVKENSIVHTQGFGRADDNGREIKSDTPFMLGSTTKSFTAMAVLQLVEQGKIDLDAPVQNYIPWFRIRDVDSSSYITIRHLLNQTSGFSTISGRKYFTDDDRSDTAIEKGVRALKDVDLIAPVGQRFIYSNLNYDILGLVIQMVSGVSYEQYIERNIFTPLEMLNSYTDKEKAIRNGLAVGYNFFRGKPYKTPNVPFVRRQISDGFLISSAADLGNYMIAQLNEGQFKGRKLLSNEYMSIYHTPVKNNYAMGWRNYEINEKKIIEHNGLLVNYKSNIILLPEEKWGVSLLFNGQDSVFNGAANGIAMNVIRILSGNDPMKARVSPFGYVFYTVVAIAMLQIIGIFRTFYLLKRWKKKPPFLNWVGYFRYVIFPFGSSIFLSISLLVLLPKANQIPLSGALLFAPDLAWVALVSGTIALIWGTIRTTLVIITLLRINKEVSA